MIKVAYHNKKGNVKRWPNMTYTHVRDGLATLAENPRSKGSVRLLKNTAEYFGQREELWGDGVRGSWRYQMLFSMTGYA